MRLIVTLSQTKLSKNLFHGPKEKSYKLYLDIVNLNFCSTKNEVKFNCAMDQIIWKLISHYNFEVYTTVQVTSMLINFSTMVKQIPHFLVLNNWTTRILFLCVFFFYLISRSIMPNYFPSEPMDIKGEAECAVVQPDNGRRRERSGRWR